MKLPREVVRQSTRRQYCKDSVVVLEHHFEWLARPVVGLCEPTPSTGQVVTPLGATGESPQAGRQSQAHQDDQRPRSSHGQPPRSAQTSRFARFAQRTADARGPRKHFHESRLQDTSIGGSARDSRHVATCPLRAFSAARDFHARAHGLRPSESEVVLPPVGLRRGLGRPDTQTKWSTCDSLRSISARDTPS
jgi:hypothetical protein